MAALDYRVRRLMYFFVTQKTGTDKAFYETHCARDYEHALELCRIITQYYPSTCEIVVLNNGHLRFFEFTQSGDVQLKPTSDDFTTQPLQATAS